MADDSQRRDKQWVLLAYDIRDPKRLARVCKIAESYGERVQYSLFRCRLSRRQLERMNWELAQATDKKDALLVAPICARCAEQIESRDNTPGRRWNDEETPFRIL